MCEMHYLPLAIKSILIRLIVIYCISLLHFGRILNAMNDNFVTRECFVANIPNRFNAISIWDRVE